MMAEEAGKGEVQRIGKGCEEEALEVGMPSVEKTIIANYQTFPQLGINKPGNVLLSFNLS